MLGHVRGRWGLRLKGLPEASFARSLHGHSLLVAPSLCFGGNQIGPPAAFLHKFHVLLTTVYANVTRYIKRKEFILIFMYTLLYALLSR